VKAAVGGPAIVGAPGTIRFGNARARIDRGQRDKSEQSDADADHGASPNCPPRSIDRARNAFIPGAIRTPLHNFDRRADQETLSNF